MKTQLPPLRALHVFDVFGRHQSVATTARALGVTPGAVSQQLKILEEHLGTALVLKEGRRAALTPFAMQYHRDIAQGFDALRQAQQVFERQNSDIDLTLSGLPTLLLKWLNPKIHRFQAETGTVALRLDATHAEPDPKLLGQMFRLTYGAAAEHFSHRRALFTDHCFPVCAPEFLQQNPQANSASALSEMPWIDIDWGPAYDTVPRLGDWLAAQGSAPSRRKPVSVHSLSSLALEAAIAGQGIALAQASFVALDLELGRLVRLSDQVLPMPEPYYICWGKSTLNNPNARGFLNWLLAEVERPHA